MGEEAKSRNRQNKSSGNPDVKQGRPKGNTMLSRLSEVGRGAENDKERGVVINILKREKNVKASTTRKILKAIQERRRQQGI